MGKTSISDKSGTAVQVRVKSLIGPHYGGRHQKYFCQDDGVYRFIEIRDNLPDPRSRYETVYRDKDYFHGMIRSKIPLIEFDIKLPDFRRDSFRYFIFVIQFTLWSSSVFDSLLILDGVSPITFSAFSSTPFGRFD